MGLLDEEEFREWVLKKAMSRTAQELVEDDTFSCRLLKDAVFGRSKTFNKGSRKNKDQAGGLQFLYKEYCNEIGRKED